MSSSPLEHPQADVFERIEAAISEWTRSTEGTRRSYLERLEHAKGRIDSEIALRDAEAVAAAVAVGMEAIVASLKDFGDSQEATRTCLTSVMDGLRLLHAELHAVTAQMSELSSQQESSTRLEPAAVKLESDMREQLDTAHEEIVNLRAEIDLLRSANASLAEATNLGAAEPFRALKTLDATGNKRRMGSILVDAGVITHRQLDHALAEQAATPYKRLGSILIDSKFTTEEIIADVLAGQLKLSRLHLRGRDITADVVQLVPEKVASHHVCVPVDVDDMCVILAMANPLDLIAIEDIERITGRRVEPAVSTWSEIKETIERFPR